MSALSRAFARAALVGFIALAALGPGAPAGPAHADDEDTNFYFVRHVQTVANVVKKYSWENQRTFTDRGVQEIESLTKELEKLEIDRVIVSPTWRTLHTISPYLKKFVAKTGRVAEIWPEIEECCYQPDRESAAADPMPRLDFIELGDDIKSLFGFPNEESRRWYDVKSYADSVKVLTHGCAQLRERFGGSGESVVVVGHFTAGARLVQCLTGEKAAGISFENGVISHIRQDADGSFRIVTLNGKPYSP